MSAQRFAILLSMPVILFMLAVMSYPMVYSLWLSFQEVSLLGGFNMDYVGFRNYIDVLQSSEFWWATWVTVHLTVESVVLSVGIGLGVPAAPKLHVFSRSEHAFSSGSVFFQR